MGPFDLRKKTYIYIVNLIEPIDNISTWLQVISLLYSCGKWTILSGLLAVRWAKQHWMMFSCWRPHTMTSHQRQLLIGSRIG